MNPNTPSVPPTPPQPNPNRSPPPHTLPETSLGLGFEPHPLPPPRPPLPPQLTSPQTFPPPPSPTPTPLGWSLIPSPLSPCPRSLHVSCVYSSSIYIFGGYDGGSRVNDFYRYEIGNNNSLKERRGKGWEAITDAVGEKRGEWRSGGVER